MKRADSALFDAVRPSNKSRPEKIRSLIADGADVAARDEDGTTPLHHAVQARFADGDPKPSPEVVRVLLESGADPNALDGYGRSPLNEAIPIGDNRPAKRSLAIVTLLLDHGARVDEDGSTLARFNSTTAAIYALLLDRGADVTLRDERANTPLHAVARSGRAQLMELLLARGGVDLGAVNDLGQTPLCVALRQPRSEVVTLLEAAGAPVLADFPTVEGGPLPIDMPAVRQAAAERGGPKKFLKPVYASHQDLVNEMRFIDDPDHCLPVLAACAAVLGDDGRTTLTLTGDQVWRRPFFHHGDIVVKGHIDVLTPFAVTGSLLVDGCVSDAGPDSFMVIGGDVRAWGVNTDGELQVSGTVEAEVVYGSYNDNSLVADTIRARLLIEDDHAVEADVEAEHHFDIDTYQQGYGDGVPERLRAILIDEVFDEDSQLDPAELFDRLRDRHPVFR
ncbi:ankyrin repeat domain-containing protein [Phytohabitans rumicis]|uniref:ankyrin repeat domain-containing protein n=1 Tax=Phytohabitans rumicis TaxID=1076125 RepID=UPI0015656E4E|nr:ankyrin repeat domain-containing protein [Phytohabitans rumicis]